MLFQATLCYGDESLEKGKCLLDYANACALQGSWEIAQERYKSNNFVLTYNVVSTFAFEIPILFILHFNLKIFRQVMSREYMHAC